MLTNFVSILEQLSVLPLELGFQWFGFHKTISEPGLGECINVTAGFRRFTGQFGPVDDKPETLKKCLDASNVDFLETAYSSPGAFNWTGTVLSMRCLSSGGVEVVWTEVLVGTNETAISCNLIKRDDDKVCAVIQ